MSNRNDRRIPGLSSVGRFVKVLGLCLPTLACYPIDFLDEDEPEFADDDCGEIEKTPGLAGGVYVNIVPGVPGGGADNLGDDIAQVSGVKKTMIVDCEDRTVTVRYEKNDDVVVETWRMVSGFPSDGCQPIRRVTPPDLE